MLVPLPAPSPARWGWLRIRRRVVTVTVLSPYQPRPIDPQVPARGMHDVPLVGMVSGRPPAGGEVVEAESPRVDKSGGPAGGTAGESAPSKTPRVRALGECRGVGPGGRRRELTPGTHWAARSDTSLPAVGLNRPPSNRSLRRARPETHPPATCLWLCGRTVRGNLSPRSQRRRPALRVVHPSARPAPPSAVSAMPTTA